MGDNRRARLEYIDAVKAIAIMMIMMGHITALPNHFDTWLSSCKLTTFYVISGFLMAYTGALQKRSPAVFTGHLAKAVCWPYLTFSAGAILAKFFFTYTNTLNMGKALHSAMEAAVDALFLKGIHSMWFLPTLFFGELIIMALYHSPKAVRVIYALGALFTFRGAVFLKRMVQHSELPGIVRELARDLIYTGGKSVVAAWFIGFGYLIYLFMSRRDLLHGHYKAKFCAGAVMVLSNACLCQLNNSVNFNSCDMGNRPPVFVYGGTIGALGLILLLDAVSSRVDVSPLGYWGRNSLILMCTHVPFGFRTIARSGWNAVAHIPKYVGVNYFVQCFCVLGVLMLMEYGVIELINRFFPFMTRFPDVRKSSGEDS